MQGCYIEQELGYCQFSTMEEWGSQRLINTLYLTAYMWQYIRVYQLIWEPLSVLKMERLIVSIFRKMEKMKGSKSRHFKVSIVEVHPD